MIISFEELKSEEYVLNLGFCLNYGVCQWVGE